MTLLISVGIVLFLLCLSELWWRRSQVHTEISRKFVHITVGSFVAFWPFFMSWTQIEGLSAAFLAGVLLSKYLRIFKAIHSVQRPTWGEMFFAMAVGGTALITHNKWIYLTALLQMSLADGLAAIIGVRFGSRHRYLIFGQAKSMAGTLMFASMSLLILVVYDIWSGVHLDALAVAGLVAAASLLENFGVWGLDNLFVPLLVAESLHLLG